MFCFYPRPRPPSPPSKGIEKIVTHPILGRGGGGAGAGHGETPNIFCDFGTTHLRGTSFFTTCTVFFDVFKIVLFWCFISCDAEGLSDGHFCWILSSSQKHLSGCRKTTFFWFSRIDKNRQSSEKAEASFFDLERVFGNGLWSDVFQVPATKHLGKRVFLVNAQHRGQANARKTT